MEMKLGQEGKDQKVENKEKDDNVKEKGEKKYFAFNYSS